MKSIINFISKEHMIFVAIVTIIITLIFHTFISLRYVEIGFISLLASGILIYFEVRKYPAEISTVGMGMIILALFLERF